MARVLFHIDLNAFLPLQSELRNPELKEFPIAVGSLSSRGVLTTANYKAREFECILPCRFDRHYRFVLN